MGGVIPRLAKGADDMPMAAVAQAQRTHIPPSQHMDTSNDTRATDMSLYRRSQPGHTEPMVDAELVYAIPSTENENTGLPSKLMLDLRRAYLA